MFNSRQWRENTEEAKLEFSEAGHQAVLSPGQKQILRQVCMKLEA